MECDICTKKTADSPILYCVSCARTQVYHPRLEYAQVLLESNALKSDIEKVLACPDQSGPKPLISSDNIVWNAEVQQLHVNETKKRIDQIRVYQRDAKRDCDAIRLQIEKIKENISKRKGALGAIDKNASLYWKETQAQVSPVTNKVSVAWTILQHKSGSSRSKLCQEAASLMRLRQRRRQKDAQTREQFSIAGLTLPDLREISNVRCTDLSAVLGSVAHLTILVAFYLGIRLPAEITPPSADSPSYTINTPSTSYRGHRRDSANFTHGSSLANSPSASRNEIGTVSGPRPLFVASETRDERLYNFQKTEPQAFNLFVEGLALLAWDIAWLCRTQGFNNGTNEWEDICNVGKNLHQLLATSSQAPGISRIQSDRSVQKRSSPSRKQSATVSAQDVTGKRGQYSDLSAANLNMRSSQTQMMRTWNYLSWQAVAMSLRKTLLTEITSAEWEVLQDEEWDDGTEQFDEAVFVKPRVLDGQQFDDARSVMTARTKVSDEAQEKTSGTSGWTKLKSRDKP